MSRRAKWLVGGVAVVVAVGMMFAAASRRVYRGGVLAPLSGMAVRDRTMVIQEARSVATYLRTMVIDGATAKDVESRISANLQARGYERSEDAGWIHYHQRSTSWLPSVTIRQIRTKPSSRLVVSDIHSATTLEVSIARVRLLGKKLPTLDEVRFSEDFWDE